jgi:hypothetical protein
MNQYHLEMNENEIIKKLSDIVIGTWHWEPTRKFSLATWVDPLNNYTPYLSQPIYTPAWWSKPGVEIQQAPATGYVFTTFVSGEQDMKALVEVLSKFGIQSRLVSTPGVYIPLQDNLLELLQKNGKAIHELFVAKVNELEASYTPR